jgi:hypothetical protein
MRKVSEVFQKLAEVAQPGRALDSSPACLRAKLKTGLSPVQTRPSAPWLDLRHFHFLFLLGFLFLLISERKAFFARRQNKKKEVAGSGDISTYR